MLTKNLVLVGSGHTHLHLLKNAHTLKKHNFQITLISPTEFYYNGLAPGVLSNYYPKKIGFLPIECYLDTVNGQYIQEKVVSISVDEKRVILSNGERIPYDFISFNIGAKGKIDKNELFPTRPVSKLWLFQNKLKDLIEQSTNNIRVAIVGGGAAGVELAGNIHQYITAQNIESSVMLITSSVGLLSQFPASAGRKVIKNFQKRGIEILVNSRVVKSDGREIILANQEEIPYDLGISATGIVPNTVESQNALKTTPQGELIVNKYLQCEGHSTLFAAGDCICFESRPLWKSGIHAINQGSVLLHNILAVDKNTKLRPYKPKRYILTALNLGDGTGIAIVGRFTYHGKFAFKIKDYWERRFLRVHKC